MKGIRSLLLALACYLSAFSLAAEAQQDALPVTTQRFAYQVTPAYTLYLEADIPEGAGPFPYLIYVHGGGWQNGDLDVFKKQSRYLASRGIAGIRISYPLLPQGGTCLLASAAIDQAVDFVRKKAADLRIDNSRSGFCGASAGAHLAALAAMRTAGCELFIGMAGAYNLLTTQSGNFPTEELRTTYLQSTDSAVIKSASPLYRIPPRNIPACLFMHGTNDQVVDYSQSQDFATALNKQGAVTKIILYKGVDHGVNSRTDTALFRTTVQDMYAFCSETFSRKRVACVGNSITYGVLVDNATDAYPAMLQEQLGASFEVRNFGVPGASVQFTKDKTYLKTKQFEELLAYKPDILILKLGTNDSRPNEWSTDDFFYADYVRLVRELKRIGCQVYLCDPIPPFGDKWTERDKILTNKVIPLIHRIAKEEQLPVIDLYHTYPRNSSSYFLDGIHPTRAGYTVISSTIYQALQQYSIK